MKPGDFEGAEEEAETLLKEYHGRFGAGEEIIPPIPVELIAELFYDLKIDRDKVGRNIPGKLDLENKKIILSSGDTLERQRFTVAHEIGHMRLHINDNKGHLTLRRAKKPSWMEMEANAFAAALLLPKKLCYEIFIKEILNIQRVKRKDIEWLLIFVKRSRNFRGLNHLLRTYLFTNRKAHPEHIDKVNLLVSLIPRVARKFRVSTEALAWRLKNLGLADEFINQTK